MKSLMTDDNIDVHNKRLMVLQKKKIRQIFPYRFSYV